MRTGRFGGSVDSNGNLEWNILSYTIPTTLNVYYLFIEYDLRRCEYDLRSIGIIILSAHCNLYFR